MIPPFERWIKNPFEGKLLTFDPGQTTGYSIWEKGSLREAGQLATRDIREFHEHQRNFILNVNPAICVMEEYRIYQWKTEQHAWSDVHTIQLIGVLKFQCYEFDIPIRMQGAGLAKGFATDEKLKDWGFWKEGYKHARDAIRHGCYFYCSSSNKP